MRRQLIVFFCVWCTTSVHAGSLSPAQCESFLNFIKAQDQDIFLNWPTLANALGIEEAAIVTLRLPRTNLESMRSELTAASIPIVIEANDDAQTYASVVLDREHLPSFLRIGNESKQIAGTIMQSLSRAERNVLADETNHVRIDALKLLEEIAGQFVNGETLYSQIFPRVAEQTLSPQKARRFILHRPPPRPIGPGEFDLERFGLAWKFYLQLALDRPSLLNVHQAQADMRALVEKLKTKPAFSHLVAPTFAPKAEPPKLGRRSVELLGKFLRRVAKQLSPEGLATLGFECAIRDFVSPANQPAALAALHAIELRADDLYVASNLEKLVGPTPAVSRLSTAWFSFKAFADQVDLSNLSSNESLALLESKLPPKIIRRPRVKPKTINLQPKVLPPKIRVPVEFELSTVAANQLAELRFEPEDIELMLNTANGILIRDVIQQLPTGAYGTSMYAAKSRQVFFAEVKGNVILRFYPDFAGAEARYLQEESKFENVKAIDLNIGGHPFEIPARIVYKFKLMFDIAPEDLQRKLKSAQVKFLGVEQAEIFLSKDPHGFRVKFNSAVMLFNIIHDVQLIEPAPPTHQ